MIGSVQVPLDRPDLLLIAGNCTCSYKIFRHWLSLRDTPKLYAQCLYRTQVCCIFEWYGDLCFIGRAQIAAWYQFTAASTVYHSAQCVPALVRALEASFYEQSELIFFTIISIHLFSMGLIAFFLLQTSKFADTPESIKRYSTMRESENKAVAAY